MCTHGCIHVFIYIYIFYFFLLVDWCRHTAIHVRVAASALVRLRLGVVSRTQDSYIFGWAALVSESAVALYAGTVNPHWADGGGRSWRWSGSSGEDSVVVGMALGSSYAVMWRVLIGRVSGDGVVVVGVVGGVVGVVVVVSAVSYCIVLVCTPSSEWEKENAGEGMVYERL